MNETFDESAASSDLRVWLDDRLGASPVATEVLDCIYGRYRVHTHDTRSG